MKMNGLPVVLLVVAIAGAAFFAGRGCNRDRRGIETMRHDWCASTMQGVRCDRIPKYGYAFCYNHKDMGGQGVRCHAVVNGVRCSAMCKPQYIFCLPHKDCWKIGPTLPDPGMGGAQTQAEPTVAIKPTASPVAEGKQVGIQTLPYTTCAYNADGGSCSQVPNYGYAYCLTHKDMAKRRMTGGQCHAVVDGVRCKKTCKPAYIFCLEHKDCWKMGPTLSR